MRKFIDIFVGFPGRVHDARVFRSSPIYHHLTDRNHLLLQHNHHLLGDSAYPLLGNLLTPFRDNGHLTEDQIRYNVKLSTVRSIIERTFGRLKGKFWRLKYLDIADPEFGTALIIAAACVLHNFSLIYDNDVNNDEDAIDQNDEDDFQQVNIQLQDHREIGVQKRTNIVELLSN